MASRGKIVSSSSLAPMMTQLDATLPLGGQQSAMELQGKEINMYTHVQYVAVSNIIETTPNSDQAIHFDLSVKPAT